MIWVLVIGKGTYDTDLNLCLTARAFGASAITFSPMRGKTDPKLTKYCESVNKKWGGKFSVDFSADWKPFLGSKKNYIKVYLTRYGIPMKKLEYAVKTYKNIILVITMSESVKSLYGLVDFNISISSQPHSSVSALAVFLDNFYKGRELAMHFENASYRVVPEEHDIHVEKA